MGYSQTGVAPHNDGLSLNLARNWSDTRTLDDVQLRVNEQRGSDVSVGYALPDHHLHIYHGTCHSAFRAKQCNDKWSECGESARAVLTGGTSATIPQVSYEDLGLTLKAKPGHFNAQDILALQLDLTIQAALGQRY